MRRTECSETCLLAGGKCSPEAARSRAPALAVPADVSATRGPDGLTGTGLASDRVPPHRDVPGCGRCAADHGGEPGRAARPACRTDDGSPREAAANTRRPGRTG